MLAACNNQTKPAEVWQFVKPAMDSKQERNKNEYGSMDATAKGDVDGLFKDYRCKLLPIIMTAAWRQLPILIRRKGFIKMLFIPLRVASPKTLCWLPKVIM